MDQKIVHEGAGAGEQAGVLRLAVGELRGVVGGDVLDQLERMRAADFDLAHVADVEQARGGARGHVFGDDAGILDRHVPAAEIHHPGAHAAMRSEWSAVLRNWMVVGTVKDLPWICESQ